MNQQPKLYCLCGATIVDEFGQGTRGASSCSVCKKDRCPKCMWDHLKKCHPVDYLGFRNRLQLGQINEHFEITKAYRQAVGAP